ncbi:hypothetical protein GOODEAATRI_020242 [Goodea atripinnis]|uniref:Uncharacterized protein n=1 Tax=Goodea atripinnis TaxID=208336 RepID=A0ABV0NLS6_9TELE
MPLRIFEWSAVINHRMWDQVRVDHGKEFYSPLFIQEILAPYRQTTILPNHINKGSGCPKKVSQVLLPQTPEAVTLYAEEGTLTRESLFGIDPFPTEEEKAMVECLFAETYPDLADLFNSTVNKNLSPFKDAVIHLINVTKRQA